MAGRTIAIGDIHGCSIALGALLHAIRPRPDDTIVTLGDYVDRGVDTRGALDLLIELGRNYHLVPILGNHDEMMLRAREDEDDFHFWINCFGQAAIDSYGATGRLSLIPESHFEFLARCLPYFETDTHLFLHANYAADLPLDQQDIYTLRWLSMRDVVPGPHCSGKIAVVGHTPQPDVLDLGHVICVDTGCATGGWLTGLDVATGQKWQVDQLGMPRTC